MRSLIVLIAVVLAGCTVTIDGDETGSPSEFLTDFRFASLAATLPGGDARAPGVGEGGGEGMTTHKGRKYYKKSSGLRLEMPAGNQAEFLRSLQVAFKDAINATDVRVQGEGVSTNGETGQLNDFSFEYVNDDVFGWISVVATSYGDELALDVQIHEAEI